MNKKINVLQELDRMPHYW